MSDLVVLDFDGVGAADEVLTKLRGMQKENLIDLEDACVAVHTEAGKVQVKQAVNLTSLGAASDLSTGMLIGALAGLPVLNPLDDQRQEEDSKKRRKESPTSNGALDASSARGGCPLSRKRRMAPTSGTAFLKVRIPQAAELQSRFVRSR
jgi:hypothetical protein